ncbi:3-ketoacyl-ACP reductase [Verminephrobacter aporrectodeae]|uniref:3-ketoacyl-ACP reductase n=1 Tax=Verminephrobacter aporrectodeae TaxID=1110389 RepID=UPI0022388D5D|nr:3-ketoacyl-ACP reductase [Verminephrobacter aporrectodeae]MCW5220903.1 3-ketoacyl-ACP reductase [Verminephrobacter aporrectodeae subsp. tuberculatae]MCW5290198.1 3-ketoacyl-ACP reductase [Verminephrobacter aporrectodeae subsp. tuberculatae]MCW8174529.1 3-ketoacyl-ACP reductase [Verminephrobacter aporrectodeae subsp. tuberculatae]MCW8197881.1 3-ketoacyl-ACP reductase [Verminephrobacter aporrectodeae subsp. tuberculatae]MCW8202179.1 3-ketoacyl-ACP reductase [Verminephrobacter aporrectodeae su
MHAARALAVVTGARRGIGAAIAIDLAAQGFDLAITDLGPEGADATLDAIGAHGGRARFFASDLAEVGAHPALVDAITDWGGPIVALVNNAGIGSPRRGDLLEVPPQTFDRVLGVNLRGTFFMTQAVARHMLQTPAPAAAPARSIVTLSSVSADMASVERAEYCLSKSGLSMLTKLFALRLAAAGIGVFEIRPGVIRTPMTQAVSADYDQRIAQGLVPMHRWGQPDDVARAVRALALGQLAFASGSVLCVDGALSIPRL